jgi:diguanylate cyclase (GGDEF)-like protein
MQTNKINILIVEDDDKIFNELKAALTDKRYKLWRVTSGREALKLLQDIFFAVVITEIRLKDMRGLDFINKTSKIDDRISIVALIAYSFVQSGLEALKAGAYMYVSKPINHEEIKVIVKKSLQNISLLIQANKMQYYQGIAIFDGLTGVYNHRYFHQALQFQFGHMRRSPQSFSLFIIDIDDFKKYNDTKGHPEGDKVLHNTAQTLVDQVRTDDQVFRYGGEEFAVILPRTTQIDAKKVGERLCKTVAKKLPITISMGLATVPDNTHKKSELVEKADKALYRAKESGKNQLCVYDPEIDK